MSYGDYVEQLTYLLFLKMADERSKPPFNLAGESPSPILQGYDWPSPLAKDGDELFDHYRHTLEKLGAEKGTIGLIFTKALNKFQDPTKLRRLVVDLIECESWSANRHNRKPTWSAEANAAAGTSLMAVGAWLTMPT